MPLIVQTVKRPTKGDFTEALNVFEDFFLLETMVAQKMLIKLVCYLDDGMTR